MASRQNQTVYCKPLLVDESYQRPITPHWLNSIVKNFDEKQIRPLVLSRRSDGRVFIVDGNHTRTAALKVYGDNARLPAVVFTGLTVDQEAALFHQLNSNSKKVSYNEKLRALVASGNEEALEYIDALNQSGIRWGYYKNGKTGTLIGHWGGIRTYQKYGNNIFVRACRIVALTDDREMTNAKLIAGICYLLTNTPITDAGVLDVLKRYTHSDVTKLVRAYGTSNHASEESSDRSYALAILNLYNKGKRKRRITLEVAV